MKSFRFWDTQPVPKLDEDTTEAESGPLEVKTVDQIRKEPLDLPAGFTWCDVCVDDPEELEEVYKFLAGNYVEDNDAMFRFNYSPEFLKWALQPPGMKREWHLGVRAPSKDPTNKRPPLYGFISAIPVTMRLQNKTDVEMVEINFLCVHKRLREKRLAPVLIREITRRCNINGIFQAAYTAGVLIPTPVCKCQYYHRSLDPKKLIETNFTRLQPRQTLARLIKLYRLPEAPVIPGAQPLTEQDLPQALALLSSYLDKFEMRPVFNVDDFRHWFMPRKDVITTYVVKNDQGAVTDMFSFYTLPSTVINNPLHNVLNVAYSFYNVATSVNLVDLMNDSLTVAKQTGHDVFNALDLMENTSFLGELKFGRGDGCLHYYLYNWRMPKMESPSNGLVLL